MTKPNPDKAKRPSATIANPADKNLTEIAQADSETHGKTHKLAIIITLLRRPEGASINELTKATGWQAHSVRALISRAVRKKQVLTVVAEGVGRSRIYRVAG
jgi:hypothetical protein